VLNHYLTEESLIPLKFTRTPCWPCKLPFHKQRNPHRTRHRYNSRGRLRERLNATIDLGLGSSRLSFQEPQHINLALVPTASISEDTESTYPSPDKKYGEHSCECASLRGVYLSPCVDMMLIVAEGRKDGEGWNTRGFTV